MIAVDFGQRVEFAPLLVERHARLDVPHRFRARKNERALMASWKEIGGPHLTARVRRLRRDHHERGQVLVRGAQPVTHPGPDARPGLVERTGVHPERGVVVVRVVGVHRANQGNVVGTLRDVGEEFADFNAALPAFLELPLWPLQEQLFVAGAIARFGVVERHRLAVIGGELRLRVEGIDVRHAAGHEQEDDVRGLRREVRRLRGERVGTRGFILGEQLRHERGEQRTSGHGRAEEPTTRKFNRHILVLTRRT